MVIIIILIYDCNRTASFDSRLNKIGSIPEDNLPAVLQIRSPGTRVSMIKSSSHVLI